VLANYYFLSPHFAAPPMQLLAESSANEEPCCSWCSCWSRLSCCECCSDDKQQQRTPPPWFAFPAFVFLSFEWSLYVVRGSRIKYPSGVRIEDTDIMLCWVVCRRYMSHVGWLYRDDLRHDYSSTIMGVPSTHCTA